MVSLWRVSVLGFCIGAVPARACLVLTRVVFVLTVGISIVLSFHVRDGMLILSSCCKSCWVYISDHHDICIELSNHLFVCCIYVVLESNKFESLCCTSDFLL